MFNCCEKTACIPFSFFLSSFSLSCRLPFDWKTPIGYFIALMAQCVPGACSTFSFTSVTCFLIESALLSISILKDIENDLSALNFVDLSSKKDYERIKKQFNLVVRNYTDAKQLSRIFFYDWRIVKSLWNCHHHKNLSYFFPLEWSMNLTESTNISLRVCFYGL